MGVSASVMVRSAFIGGLTIMGVCLTWIGAVHPPRKIQQHFPPALPLLTSSLPPAIAPVALPAPAPFIIAKPAPVFVPYGHYRGTIESSLYESAVEAGVPTAMLGEMIRIFSYDVDFQRDIQPDDKFELVFERSPDKKASPKLLFASMTLSGKKMDYYRYADQQGFVDYYSKEGESVRKALLKTPVDGAKISSGFGRRFHPIRHYTTEHKGVDFAVMTGTPVMAAGAGTVEMAGANGSYGIYVRIKHDGAHSTAYGHLSRLAPGIRPGKHVAQGQTIAYSGSTGRSTGPHLHYEVLVKDEQVNPMSVKFQSGRKLAGKELARFQASERQTSALLTQTPVGGHAK